MRPEEGSPGPGPLPHFGKCKKYLKTFESV